MTLILRDQPHATLLVLAVSRVVSHSEWVEPGSRVVLAATEEEPQANVIFNEAERPRPEIGWWKDAALGGAWLIDKRGWSAPRALPLGMVVGTAVVAEALQIVEFGASSHPDGSDALPPCVEVEGAPAHRLTHWGVPDYWTHESDERDLTAELAFDPDGFVPGRWALMLDDAKPVSARCPGCWGEPGYRNYVPNGEYGESPHLTVTCSLCSGSGVVDDPGASGLRVEEWTS